MPNGSLGRPDSIVLVAGGIPRDLRPAAILIAFARDYDDWKSLSLYVIVAQIAVQL